MSVIELILLFGGVVMDLINGTGNETNASAKYRSSSELLRFAPSQNTLVGWHKQSTQLLGFAPSQWFLCAVLVLAVVRS